jgi:uncharacterized membrane protein (DUF2068 family)
MKNPPVLVSVIGFFAALAGFAWLFLGLRLIGFDWFGTLGDAEAFESAALWGWLLVGGGILWVVAAFGLWTLRRWAWMVAMVVAGIAVAEAFFYMLAYPGSGVGLGMMLMPGIILLYLNSHDVRAAFAQGAAAA